MRTAGSALFLCLLSGCTKQESFEPLALTVSGCASWLAGGECVLSSGTALTAWFPAAERDVITIKTGTTALAFESVSSGVGRRLIFRPGHELEITVRSSTVARRASIELQRTTTASAALATYEAGRRARDVTKLQEARVLARAGGDRSIALRSALLAAFIVAMRDRDVSRAEKLLDEEPEPPAIDGDGRVLYFYHRGLVAQRAGNYRAAVRALDLAGRLATDLGLALRPVVENLHALVLLDLGRGEEALQIFTRIENDPAIAADPCSHGAVVANIGWARLLAGDENIGASPAGEDVGPLLQQAREIFRSSCKDGERENNALVNLALFHLERGDPKSALARLEEIRGDERAHARAWRIALEARALLELGQLEEAERRFSTLRETAELGSFDELEWMAQLGRGRVLEARRQDAKAIAAYREAEQILDRASLLVPIDRGRLHYLGNRAESLDRLVAALLRVGQKREAFDARRLARRRATIALALLSSRVRFSPQYEVYRRTRDELEQSLAGAWKDTRADAARNRAMRDALRRRSLDALDEVLALLPEHARGAELLRPKTGELFAGIFQSVRSFELYLSTEQTIRAQELDHAPSPEELEAFLGSELTSAEKVFVFSAEPLRGAIAGDLRYAADLPRLPPRSIQTPTQNSIQKNALVIADPRGDLAAARIEGEEVARALERSGVVVERLFGDRATLAAVRDGLERAELLHYAGHAELAGADGWETALLVADGRLEVGDIVTLARVPSRVVLFGCETGAQLSVRATAGIGLATAFLIAGSETVIATSEKVNDRATREQASALYREGSDASAFGRAFHIFVR